MVPERKKPDALSNFVQLLKDQNIRLQEERETWINRYHELYVDYIALQYGNQCHTFRRINL